MNNSINICNRCDQEITQSRKYHNYNYHTDEVFIGESLLSVKRSDEGFICPVCESILNTTMGFKHHSNHHNLNFRISKKRVNDEDTDYSSEFSESEEFEISEISKDLLAHHIPPSALSLDNSSNPQKKKLKLTNSETVLASSDSLTADNQTKADKIMLAKLGCWVPLIYNRGNQQYGVLASPSSASLLLQDSQEPGTWESPIPDGETCSTSLVKTDGDSLIAHIKSTCKASRKLSITCHIELSQKHVHILNQDWLEYPQLRFCGSQLLAGAIIIEKQTSMLVNTVEPYARDPLPDAHYERSPTKSSFPTEPGIYGHIRICLLDSPDGKKLVLGTRVCNFLVTSSMRLDVNSCNISPSTTHFTPSDESRIFLDNSSIQFVTEMIENPDINECQVMPVLNQLRQGVVINSFTPFISTYNHLDISFTR
ncbi:hypothetical protein G6F70_009072 [Rhizopus microsporus]|nr:hypothetical protein G6F71_007657 [Rhizopus microsporus]KAG1193433.1 hypothetical protein G6F70_009072 [Rhizopus microsporus]KAG1207423.1 hypothetical protein G6F69_008063 [Rhizopus microsporus]KAG1225676.1 hypothetical protein G6F67_009240 [Rhizopus microsporus]KAG1258307.1 hypothetical protein G6F68_008841 [Rhizopus microsporus]